MTHQHVVVTGRRPSPISRSSLGVPLAWNAPRWFSDWAWFHDYKYYRDISVGIRNPPWPPNVPNANYCSVSFCFVRFVLNYIVLFSVVLWSQMKSLGLKALYTCNIMQPQPYRIQSPQVFVGLNYRLPSYFGSSQLAILYIIWIYVYIYIYVLYYIYIVFMSVYVYIYIIFIYIYDLRGLKNHQPVTIG